MRARSTPALLLCILAGACSRSQRTEVLPDPAVPAPTTSASAESAGGKVPLGPPPHGLAVEVKVVGPSRIQAGSAIELRAELVNRSRDRTLTVVQAGDGSDFGWREPQIFYVVEVEDAEGRWKAAPSARPGRCGNYDEDWTDEIRTLAPGARLALEIGQGPEVFFDTHEGIRARVRVGYRYGGGGTRSGLAQKPASSVPAAIAGVAPFEIVSEPVDVELAHDYALELSVHGKLRSNETVRVSDVVDVRLVSRSDVALDVKAPGWLHGAPFFFEIREVRERPVDSRMVWQDATMDPGAERPSAKLRARETLRLLGETERFGRYDGTWTWPTPGTIHVRAAFLGVRGMDLRSEWRAVAIE